MVSVEEVPFRVLFPASPLIVAMARLRSLGWRAAALAPSFGV
jgi:hypothetical protein